MVGKLINIYKKNKEVVNYLIFGVLTTVINLLTYFILTTVWLNPQKTIELQMSNIISWIIAVIFAYVTNRKYVFDSKNNNKIKEIFNFFVARLLTLMLDMVIMYLGVNILLFNDKFIKVISQIIIIASNYILSKLFVFKKSKI